MRHSCNIKIFPWPPPILLKIFCVDFYFWVDCQAGKKVLQQKDSSISNGLICTRMSLGLFSYPSLNMWPPDFWCSAFLIWSPHLTNPSMILRKCGMWSLIDYMTSIPLRMFWDIYFFLGTYRVRGRKGHQMHFKQKVWRTTKDEATELGWLEASEFLYSFVGITKYPEQSWKLPPKTIS